MTSLMDNQRYLELARQANTAAGNLDRLHSDIYHLATQRAGDGEIHHASVGHLKNVASHHDDIARNHANLIEAHESGKPAEYIARMEHRLRAAIEDAKPVLGDANGHLAALNSGGEGVPPATGIYAQGGGGTNLDEIDKGGRYRVVSPASEVAPAAAAESSLWDKMPWSQQSRDARAVRREGVKAAKAVEKNAAATQKTNEIERDAHQKVTDRLEAVQKDIPETSKEVYARPGGAAHARRLTGSLQSVEDAHGRYLDAVDDGNIHDIRKARVALHGRLDEIERHAKAAQQHIVRADEARGMMIGPNDYAAAREALKVYTDKPDVNFASKALNGRGAKGVHTNADNARQSIRDMHSTISGSGLADERAQTLLTELEDHHNKISTHQIAYNEAIRTGDGVGEARGALEGSTRYAEMLNRRVHEDVAAITPKTEAQMEALGSMAGPGIPPAASSADAGASVASSGSISNIVAREEGHGMADIGEAIKDGARATGRGVVKAAKFGGKVAGVAAVAALGIGFLMNKRETRAAESGDELSNQQMAAARAAAASPMVGQDTLMGMAKTPGAMAARVQAARGGSPDVGPLNPEVNQEYQVIS